MSKKVIDKPMSCDFCNIILEKIVQNSNVKTRGTMFQKSVQLLGYADDINIIRRTKRDVSGAFVSLETEARKIGLAVNEGKTKLMLSTRKDNQNRRLGANVSIDRFNFEAVKDFVYLGFAISSENNISAEIASNPSFSSILFLQKSSAYLRPPVR